MTTIMTYPNSYIADISNFAISTHHKAIFCHYMLMLNTISPHIISLPELTLSYKVSTVKQNIIYRQVKGTSPR